MNFKYNLKMSVRALLKRPAFSAVVILTMAIAGGANILIFSFIDAVLITPLPFKDPDQLVQVYSLKGEEQGLLSYPEFLDMQQELTLIEEMAVYRGGGRYNLSGDGQAPEELTTTFASSNLFKVLGIETHLGQYWPAEYDEKGTLSLMLTHEFWKRRFNEDPEAANRNITLDGVPQYEVHGVLPEGFSFPGRNEAFRAMAYADFVVGNRDSRSSIGLVRLKKGVTLQEFNTEIAEFAETLQTRHASSNTGVTFVAEPLKEMYTGGISDYLYLIAAATFLLLIITCVNVSNLILSKAMKQSKETALRKVLGSSKSHILQRFVLESLLLTFLGCLLGLFLMWTLKDLSMSLVGPYLPYWISVEINYSIVLFTVVVSVLVGVATGMIPALLHLSKSNFAEIFKEGAGTTGNRHQKMLRQGFVTAEIAICVLLLIGGGLLTKSFLNLQNTHPGFESENRLTFRIALSWFKYSDAEKTGGFYETSLQRIESIPGVEGVAVNSIMPLTEIVQTSTDAKSIFTIEGQSPLQQSENPYINVQRVTPNYFEVMDIPMKKGSEFDQENTVANQFSILIDEQLAQRMWGNENPIGKRIKLGDLTSEEPYLTVGGVVANVKHQSISGENIPSVYISILNHREIDAFYVVKTSVPPMTLSQRLRDIILSIDENQPTFEYLLMEDHISQENWKSRVSGILFGAIALLGVLTAVIGLFSIITYTLIQQIKEIAIRRVLGAMDADILKIVLVDVLKMALLGIGIGIVLAFILLRPLNDFLFEVDLFDVTIYLSVIISLILLSIMAAFYPMLQATRIRPAIALKKD